MIYEKQCLDCDKIFQTTTRNAMKCTRCRAKAEWIPRNKSEPLVQKELKVKPIRQISLQKECLGCKDIITNSEDEYCSTCYYESLTGKPLKEEVYSHRIFKDILT